MTQFQIEGGGLVQGNLKHCQVEVQEKYIWASFSNNKKIPNYDFQYHREGIFLIYSNTFLQNSFLLMQGILH